MQDSQTPQIANESGNSIDNFLEEVAKPTTPALGTNPMPDIPMPSYADIPKSTPPPAPAPEGVNDKGEPNFIFGADDTEADRETAKSEEHPQRRSKEYTDAVMKGIIKAEGYFTSNLLAYISGAEDSTPFKYTEGQINELVEMSEPFKDWLVHKCPSWLPFFLVWSGDKGDKIMIALKMRKIRLANEAAKAAPGVAEKVAKAAAGEGAKERTNFKINAKGEYRYDRYGKYLKADEPKEIAQLVDLEKIIEANTLSDIMKAFKIDEEYLKKNGFEA